MHDWSLMISQTTIGLTHDIQCVREKYRVREKSVLFSIKRIKIVKIKLDWLDISRDRKHLYYWRWQAILWNLAILSPRPCLNSLYVYYYALPWRIPQHSTALILSLLFLLWAFSLPIFLSSAVGTHITRERGKVMESSKIDPTFPMPESVCTVYMNCCVGQQPPPTPTLAYSILLLLVYILHAIVISFSYGLLACMSMAATDEASSSSLYIQEIIQYS